MDNAKFNAVEIRDALEATYVDDRNGTVRTGYDLFTQGALKGFFSNMIRRLPDGSTVTAEEVNVNIATLLLVMKDVRGLGAALTPTELEFLAKSTPDDLFSSTPQLVEAQLANLITGLDREQTALYDSLLPVSPEEISTRVDSQIEQDTGLGEVDEEALEILRNQP
jgi:hypothetical protein